MSKESTKEFYPAEIMGLVDKFKKDLKQSKSNVIDEIEVRHNRLLENEEAQKVFIAPYLKLDSWELLTEAVPICLGYDVNDARSGYVQSKSEYQELLKLVRSALGVTLKVLNPEEKDIKWKVEPKVFIEWAVSKNLKILPLLISLLIEEKKIKLEGVSKAQSERHFESREKVYIATIAILANWPDKCLGRGKKVSATAIANMMEEKAPFWFGDSEIPLAPKTVKEIIAKAIKLPKELT